MKNNKTFTYVMIAIVGFIWFKIFVRLKDNNSVPEVNYTSSSSTFIGKISKPKSFKLAANYRDPFRLRSIKSTAAIDPNDPSFIPKPPVERPAPKIVYWPPIKYYGFVKNNSVSNMPRALVAFDGTIYKLRKNEIFLDGFEIKSLSRDEIVMRYKGEQRTFYKVK